MHVLYEQLVPFNHQSSIVLGFSIAGCTELPFWDSSMASGSQLTQVERLEPAAGGGPTCSSGGSPEESAARMKFWAI